MLHALGIIGESLHLDAEMDTHLEKEIDSDNFGSSINKILSFFGIGKAPLGIWLFVFSFLFGLVGLVTNLILFNKNPSILTIWFPYILFESFTIALLLSRSISGIVARLFPKDSTHSISNNYELIRKKGIVRFGLSLDSGGSVSVIDNYGNIHNVQCCISETEPNRTNLKEGAEVLILDYDEEKKSFVVVPIV
jgi:Protein of unknown function (DUF1449)